MDFAHTSSAVRRLDTRGTSNHTVGKPESSLNLFRLFSGAWPTMGTTCTWTIFTTLSPCATSCSSWTLMSVARYGRTGGHLQRLEKPQPPAWAQAKGLCATPTRSWRWHGKTPRWCAWSPRFTQTRWWTSRDGRRGRAASRLPNHSASWHTTAAWTVLTDSTSASHTTRSSGRATSGRTSKFTLLKIIQVYNIQYACHWNHFFKYNVAGSV